MSLILEGRSHYPSSNMLAQVPGVGDRLARSSESPLILAKKDQKVNLSSAAKTVSNNQYREDVKSKI